MITTTIPIRISKTNLIYPNTALNSLALICPKMESQCIGHRKGCLGPERLNQWWGLLESIPGGRNIPKYLKIFQESRSHLLPVLMMVGGRILKATILDAEYSVYLTSYLLNPRHLKWIIKMFFFVMEHFSLARNI